MREPYPAGPATSSMLSGNIKDQNLMLVVSLLCPAAACQSWAPSRERTEGMALPPRLRFTTRAAQGCVVCVLPRNQLLKPLGNRVGQGIGAQESGQSQGPARAEAAPALIVKDSEVCCWAGPSFFPPAGGKGPPPQVPRQWLLTGLDVHKSVFWGFLNDL